MNRYCAKFLTGETDVDDYWKDWDVWGRGNCADYMDDVHSKLALLNFFFGALGSNVVWIDSSVLGDNKKEKYALDLILFLGWNMGYIVM